MEHGQKVVLLGWGSEAWTKGSIVGVVRWDMDQMYFCCGGALGHGPKVV